MKLFTVKGTHFECGAQVGNAMRGGIKGRLKFLDAPLAFLKRKKKLIDRAIITHALKHPEYIEELRGMAQGSVSDFRLLFILNMPEMLGPRYFRPFHCTSLAYVPARDGVALAHNEDADWFQEKKWFCMVRWEIERRIPFWSFQYPGELAGSSYQWNNQGVYSSVADVAPIKEDTRRISRNFIARTLLEASSLAQALLILKRARCASGFHYLLGKGIRIVSVEQFQNTLSVIKVKGFLGHTNHYVHARFKRRTTIPKGSGLRYTRVHELHAAESSPLKILFDTFGYPFAIYARRGGDNKTVSTALFLPQKNIVRIFNRNRARDYFELPLAGKRMKK